jgi:O-acetylhomoserine (thiol)-lyase
LTIMQLLRAGDEFSASQELYGGTRTLFEHTLARFGVKANFFNPNDPKQLEKSISPKTKAVFIESLPNPSLVVPDIEAIAAIAHKYQIPLVVDNTVPSPALLNPIKFGADIVVHSTTKYISGHGYSLGGVIIDSGKFPWNTTPHFKEFDSPDPSYHGLNFWQAFGNVAFIAKARVQLLRDIGPAASPFNSWLALIGCETLPLRMERICANAQKVAEFLKAHPKVAWVNYPGLRTGKDTVLLKKYLPRGYSGILGVGLKGGYEAGKNIGDAKSLIIHPASTTHSQLDPKDQLAAGVTPDFVRLSIGIENVDDLIEDLDAALSKT